VFGMLDQYLHEHRGDLLSLNDILCEQCTGIRDKNGREIYEGDVCNCSNETLNLFGEGIVKWDEGSFFIGQTVMPFFINTNAVIEVIGNIHETPELLNV
jgi:uncharacterized phage protein (TIGR01671 family)